MQLWFSNIITITLLYYVYFFTFLVEFLVRQNGTILLQSSPLYLELCPSLSFRASEGCIAVTVLSNTGRDRRL